MQDKELAELAEVLLSLMPKEKTIPPDAAYTLDGFLSGSGHWTNGYNQALADVKNCFFVIAKAEKGGE